MFEFKLHKQIHAAFRIDVEFKAEAGEITTLIGKSGAGKSSILNLITGLITLDQGWIRTPVQEYTQLPVHRRQFGHVQQQSYLFPHLTVMENLTYPGNEAFLLEEYVKGFELSSHLHKSVWQLSGGEAQRVSIVRTLMSRPKLLLLDEAFQALDQKLRAKLRENLKKLKIPIILVTHDLMEAYEISDQVLVIDEGKIIEKGCCQDVFHRCKKNKTASLIGIQNLYCARFNQEGLWIEDFNYQQMMPEAPFQSVAIRGNQISLEKEGSPATIQTITHRLDDVVLELTVSGLSRPLVTILSWREYEPWRGQKEVHFKINELIYLED